MVHFSEEYPSNPLFVTELKKTGKLCKTSFILEKFEISKTPVALISNKFPKIEHSYLSQKFLNVSFGKLEYSSQNIFNTFDDKDKISNESKSFL